MMLASGVLLFLLGAGVSAETGHEIVDICDFQKDTCDIESVFEFVVTHSIRQLVQHEQEQDCPIVFQNLDCYILLTERCNATGKEADLQKLRKLRRAINQKCNPSEFQDEPSILNTCVASEIPSCVGDMEYLAHDGLLPDAAHLDSQCPNFKKTITCFTSAVRNCFSPTQDIFKLNLLDRIAADLCDKDTAFSQIYRQNVDCINGLQDSFSEADKEIGVHVHKFQEFMVEKELSQAFIRRATICLESELTIAAIAGLVQKNCSRHAGRLVLILMEQLVKLCPSKYYGDEMMQVGSNYMEFLVSPNAGEMNVNVAWK